MREILHPHILTRLERTTRPPLQVRAASKEVLCRRLGAKSGAELWAHAHGRDERPVERPGPRKSVGAEVNWGVRFDSDRDAEKFLRVRGGAGSLAAWV
jgi:nucleotidyltransferase/DNA polymerase involved in DNA repair